MKNHIYASNVSLANCRLEGDRLLVMATSPDVIEKYYLKVSTDLHVEASGSVEIYLNTTYYGGNPKITIATDGVAIVRVNGVQSRSATPTTPTTPTDINEIKGRIYRLYGAMENYEKRYCFGMQISASQLRALAGLVDCWWVPTKVGYAIEGVYDIQPGWTGRDVAMTYFPPPWEDCHYLLEGMTHPIMRILKQVVSEIQEGKFLVS